ncbi:aminoacyl-tRNA hydrolase [Eubacteriaceae bacterium ES3]|nr:aminoacyl-tRNA hydrolase [Eubacteriaceae bacterium ES3]
MQIIVGLGNIGKDYEDTRHNIGFMVVEAYARKKGLEISKKEQHGLTVSFFENGQKVMLVKPTTYMNNSGLCVAGLLDYYDAEPEDLLVVYDDIDLSFGDIRIRKNGGPGTHNGMRSIISGLGSRDFARVRMGIGGPKEGLDLVHFVLGKFAKEEQPKVAEAVTEAVRGIEIWLEEGIDAAMNKINCRKK